VVANVQQVKAGLAGAAGEGTTVAAQARAGIAAADRMIARLAVVAAGTQHPKVAEAIAKAAQSKQKFAEAAALAQAAAQAANDYAAVLG
jgi:hypothetical protein